MAKMSPPRRRMIKDNEAAGEMLRIYNEWLADFCATHPDRYAGLACIPNHDAEAAIGEIERVARRGVARGLEISRRHDMAPLWVAVALVVALVVALAGLVVCFACFWALLRGRPRR